MTLLPATDLDDLGTLLAIPSISTDPKFAPRIQECAQFLHDYFRKIGVRDIAIHPTPGHPIVLAKHHVSDSLPTVLIYGHYDVQPPEPLDKWLSPPFEPTIRDGHIYARGASDDKGQFFCHIKAIEHLLNTAGTLPCNLIFLIEGEEEIGSPNLAAFLQEHASELKADIALISDTPMFSSTQPSICSSLRGLCYAEVTVFGAENDLHSGQHGGVAPNPIHHLSWLISQLKDKNDRIQIPGFYDAIDPIDPALLAQCSRLGDSDRFERLWYRPTLDCNGIWGGYTGVGAKTVIPAQASLKLSMRLVSNQDPDDIFTKLSSHLHTLTKHPFRIQITNLHGAKPIQISTAHPAFEVAKKAIEAAWGIKPIFTGEGGSIPVVLTLKEILNLNTILMGFNLPDDNIHAPNERFKIDHFQKGVVTSMEFLKNLNSTIAF